MKGVGRTVFANQKLETFDVEIIGALENSAPKQTMVMARLTGGPLANTGVIAGMSGSPVYIDGKLLGAVAFGFGFSKEAIAGITPYSEMKGLSRLGDVLLRASTTPGGLGRPADTPAHVGPPLADRSSVPGREVRRRAPGRGNEGDGGSGWARRDDRIAHSALRLRVVGAGLRSGQGSLLDDGFRAASGARERKGPRPPASSRTRRTRGGVPDPRRLRFLRDRYRDPHRQGCGLRLRASLLRHRPHRLPHAPGLGVRRVPEPPSVVQDREPARNHRPLPAGPRHRHLRQARPGAADDSGQGFSSESPGNEAGLLVHGGSGRPLHSPHRLRERPFRAAGTGKGGRSLHRDPRCHREFHQHSRHAPSGPVRGRTARGHGRGPRGRRHFLRDEQRVPTGQPGVGDREPGREGSSGNRDHRPGVARARWGGAPGRERSL